VAIFHWSSRGSSYASSDDCKENDVDDHYNDTDNDHDKQKDGMNEVKSEDDHDSDVPGAKYTLAIDASDYVNNDPEDDDDDDVDDDDGEAIHK
jgi:hypothetical protein